MKKLFMATVFSVLAGSLFASTPLSNASLSEQQMNNIRANFAKQVYYILSPLGQDLSVWCSDVLRFGDNGDGSRSSSRWTAPQDLFANGTVQDMYIYLFWAGQALTHDMEHIAALNFRNYVSQATGTTGYITDLVPSTDAMKAIFTTYNSLADIYQVHQMCTAMGV